MSIPLDTYILGVYTLERSSERGGDNHADSDSRYHGQGIQV